MFNFYGDFQELDFEGTFTVDGRQFNVRVTVEDTGDPSEDGPDFVDHDWGDPADVHDDYDDYPDEND
jgi:hypothetical protein